MYLKRCVNAEYDRIKPRGLSSGQLEEVFLHQTALDRFIAEQLGSPALAHGCEVPFHGRSETKPSEQAKIGLASGW